MVLMLLGSRFAIVERKDEGPEVVSIDDGLMRGQLFLYSKAGVTLGRRGLG